MHRPLTQSSPGLFLVRRIELLTKLRLTVDLVALVLRKLTWFLGWAPECYGKGIRKP